MRDLDDVLDFYVDDANLDGKISEVEIQGRKIIQRLLVEDENLGGTFSLTTGAQGSGKTSIDLALLKAYNRKYPKDKCFWSSTYNSPLQFIKLGLKSCHFMFFRDENGQVPVKIRDRMRDGKVVDVKKYGVPVSYFTDFDELWKQSKPNCCNAVFFGDRFKWMELLFFLRSKYQWAHIFCDEFSEIAPSDQSDVMWHRIKECSTNIKEVRKCNKNLHTNSQSVSDVDWRIRRKLQTYIYLPGARVGWNSRVYQKAVDRLTVDRRNGNMAYLESLELNVFGVTRFRNIFKPLPGISWEARVDGGGNDVNNHNGIARNDVQKESQENKS